MKIKEYLQRKYGVQEPTTITMIEANAFGIPYPLTKGWLARHGGRDLQMVNLAKLEAKLKHRGEKQKRKGKKGRRHTKAAIQIVGAVTYQNPALTKDWWNTDLDVERHPKRKKERRVSGDSFLGTYEWRTLRMKALKKYGAKCQCCGATPDTGAVMNVDHIKPRRIFPHLALDINNLQVLCGACNHGKGNWDMTDWRTEEQKVCS